MKKLSLLVLAFAVVGLLAGCTDTSTNTSVNTDAPVADTQLPAQPERQMDLYGKILSMEGNLFTIQEVDTSKDPTFAMSPEDKKAYMMKLSEEQRMALKEEIRLATLGNVQVTIPVGITISVKTAQGPDAPSKLGSLEDLTPGSYLSIWYDATVTDQKVAEYVKKAWSN